MTIGLNKLVEALSKRNDNDDVNNDDIGPQVFCWAVYPGRQVQTALRQTALTSLHCLSTVHDSANALFAAKTDTHKTDSKRIH